MPSNLSLGSHHPHPLKRRLIRNILLLCIADVEGDKRVLAPRDMRIPGQFYGMQWTYNRDCFLALCKPLVALVWPPHKALRMMARPHPELAELDVDLGLLSGLSSKNAVHIFGLLLFVHVWLVEKEELAPIRAIISNPDAAIWLFWGGLVHGGINRAECGKLLSEMHSGRGGRVVLGRWLGLHVQLVEVVDAHVQFDPPSKTEGPGEYLVRLKGDRVKGIVHKLMRSRVEGVIHMLMAEGACGSWNRQRWPHQTEISVGRRLLDQEQVGTQNTARSNRHVDDRLVGGAFLPACPVFLRIGEPVSSHVLALLPTGVVDVARDAEDGTFAVKLYFWRKLAKHDGPVGSPKLNFGVCAMGIYGNQLQALDYPEALVIADDDKPTRHVSIGEEEFVLGQEPEMLVAGVQLAEALEWVRRGDIVAGGAFLHKATPDDIRNGVHVQGAACQRDGDDIRHGQVAEDLDYDLGGHEQDRGGSIWDDSLCISSQQLFLVGGSAHTRDRRNVLALALALGFGGWTLLRRSGRRHVPREVIRKNRAA